MGCSPHAHVVGCLLGGAESRQGEGGPAGGVRTPSGPSPLRPRSSLAGRPWARDLGSPQTPESAARAPLSG